jgi:hypothetical protein
MAKLSEYIFNSWVSVWFFSGTLNLTRSLKKKSSRYQLLVFLEEGWNETHIILLILSSFKYMKNIT